MGGGQEEAAPTGRDYGCAAVAALAAVIVLFQVCGSVWVLTREGVSIGLLFSVATSLLFWFWVGLGAWRRTVWGHRPRPDHPSAR
jgi:hypothetical protein